MREKNRELLVYKNGIIKKANYFNSRNTSCKDALYMKKDTMDNVSRNKYREFLFYQEIYCRCS